MTMLTRPFLSFCWLPLYLTSFVSAGAQSPPLFGFRDAAFRASNFSMLTPDNLTVADFDGDGVDDIALSGTASNTAIFVVGKLNDGSIDFKQALMVPSISPVARLLGVTINAMPHVILVSRDGTVRDYAGWPLQQQREFSTVSNVVSAKVGDIFGTGDFAIVVVADGHVASFDLATGTSLWTANALGATDVLLTQLDADPALEVVLNSGLTLDGATTAINAQFSGGFGTRLASGHILGTTQPQLLALQNGVSVYDGLPWRFLWNADDLASGVESIAAANFDDNGRDVILAGDAQFGAVRAFDPTTHQERFETPNPGTGVNSLAMLDIAGDGHKEVAFANDSPLGHAMINVVDARLGATVWSFSPLQYGLFSPVAIGDVDGDGKLELVVANGNNTPYAEPGVVQIFDDETGELKWTSPATDSSVFDPFTIATRRVLLLPHATDNATDIVLAGADNGSGRITVIDGATHAVKFQVFQFNGGPLQNFSIEDAALADFDNDGKADIALAVQPVFGASGAEIQVYSGIDGHAIWTSPYLGTSPNETMKNLIVAPTSADHVAGVLIVVMADQVAAVDIQKRTIDWTLPVTAIDGGTYIPTGSAVAEFALFQHAGALTFYDAASRTVLRHAQLPAPLNAVHPLDGSASRLLVASGEALALFDATSNAVLSRTEFLGQSLGLGNILASVDAGNSIWKIAAGNGFGTYRFVLQPIPDEIFSGGFE